ncbi:g11594 [Coccomyxa elongata]
MQHGASCSCYYEVIETPYTKEEKARGVAARWDVCKGQLVEVAHCILIPKDQYNEHMRHTVLEHYLFRFRGEMLLCLGVGSLFNHSRTPSLDYRIDREELIIRFYAARDIRQGEELTIFYGNVWFDDTGNPGNLSSETCMHDHMDHEDKFLAALDA